MDCFPVDFFSLIYCFWLSFFFVFIDARFFSWVSFFLSFWSVMYEEDIIYMLLVGEISPVIYNLWGFCDPIYAVMMSDELCNSSSYTAKLCKLVIARLDRFPHYAQVNRSSAIQFRANQSFYEPLFSAQTFNCDASLWKRSNEDSFIETWLGRLCHGKFDMEVCLTVMCNSEWGA